MNDNIFGEGNGNLHLAKSYFEKTYKNNVSNDNYYYYYYFKIRGEQ